MSYSLCSARASLPFSELERIAIPQPTEMEVDQVKGLGENPSKSQQITHDLMESVNNYAHELINIKA